MRYTSHACSYSHVRHKGRQKTIKQTATALVQKSSLLLQEKRNAMEYSPDGLYSWMHKSSADESRQGIRALQRQNYALRKIHKQVHLGFRT